MSARDFRDDFVIHLTEAALSAPGQNPKRPGTQAWGFFEVIRAVANEGGTVGELRRRAKAIPGHRGRRGGWAGYNLTWDIGHGFIALEDPATGARIARQDLAT